MDRAVVAFFVLAYGIAWGIFGAAAWVADAAGDAAAMDLTPETLWTVLLSPQADLVFAFFLRGAMGEEPGLRGFDLVRLQARTGRLQTPGLHRREKPVPSVQQYLCSESR